MPYINTKPLGQPQQKDIKYKPDYTWYRRKEWKDLRELYINKHPLCESCLQHDRIVSATNIHHMRPFERGRDYKEKEKLLLDEKNLMSVCNRCHKVLHKLDKGGLQLLNHIPDNIYKKEHNLEFLS